MPLEFDHIAITSHNIGKDIAFYSEHFSDCKILHQDTSWALLKIGEVKLALVSSSEHPPHISFRVESRAELEELVQQFSSSIKVHRDSSESFYIFDPSGNATEIIWYPENT
jgi:catechol-2,3-dioxygenase